MTVEQILNRYFEAGGNPDLMRFRVIYLINAATGLLDQWVDDPLNVKQKNPYEVSELLRVSMETIDSEPVQVLFEDIANYEPANAQ
jgi:hypothetical protein